MLGIIIAMEREAKPFLERAVATVDLQGRKFHKIPLADGEYAVLAISGVGKVNASYTASLLIAYFKPDVILNLGVSGALADRLDIMDKVCVLAAVQHDVDTSALGDEKGFVSTVNRKYFPTDRELTENLKRVTGNKSGIAASGEQFVAGEKRKEILNAFGAAVCDMECAAVAQCAYIAKVKFVAVRCVSDRADGSASGDFGKFCDAAAELLYSDAMILAQMLKG